MNRILFARFALCAVAICGVVAVAQQRAGGADAAVYCQGSAATIAAPSVTLVGHTLTGTEGVDVIVGSAFADRIYGLGGNDKICGGGGGDVIDGGAGNDGIDGGTGNDAIYGRDHDDVINAGDGTDRVYGGNGYDTISGGAGDDLLDGELGVNRLTFPNATNGVGVNLPLARTYGEGTDTIAGFGDIHGSAFDDQFYADNFGRMFRGLGGHDWFIGGGGNDRFFGDAGNDVMHGNNSFDIMYGGSGNDRMYGGALSDVMYGEDGDDILDGQEGKFDEAHGGSGGADNCTAEVQTSCENLPPTPTATPTNTASPWDPTATRTPWQVGTLTPTPGS